MSSQYVTDASGRQTLLKQAQAAPEGSVNVRQTLTTPGKPLKEGLRSVAETVASYVAQQGGRVAFRSMEAATRSGGGLPGVALGIRKNGTTLRSMLRLFPEMFKVANGDVSLVVARSSESSGSQPSTAAAPAVRGRGNNVSQVFARSLWADGLTEPEVRAELKRKGFQASRISQLVRDTRPS